MANDINRLIDMIYERIDSNCIEFQESGHFV